MTLDEINYMDYWEARKYIATAVPRQTTLNNSPGDRGNGQVGTHPVHGGPSVLY